MHITVAICTWNRCELLNKTLMRMHQLVVPKGISWELLIIDNNCTDATGAVIDQHQNSLPIRRIVEEKQGHSYARNRALMECESDWLIYTDDDVLVSLEWLVNYVDAISNASEDCGILGGPIEPWFEIEPNVDLVKGIPVVGDGFCGKTVPADLVITKHSESLPFGANFGIRKSLVKGMRFDTNLGLKKGSRVVGEETEFMRRLLENGTQGLWVTKAMVKHWIPRQRIMLASVARHLFGLGRTSAILRAHNNLEERTNPIVARWMYRQLLESLILLMWNLGFGKKVSFYKNFGTFCYYSGYLREALLSKRRN